VATNEKGEVKKVLIEEGNINQTDYEPPSVDSSLIEENP
jgi:hypothetical protein